jgi:hypothetical protein
VISQHISLKHELALMAIHSSRILSSNNYFANSSLPWIDSVVSFSQHDNIKNAHRKKKQLVDTRSDGRNRGIKDSHVDQKQNIKADFFCR